MAGIEFRPATAEDSAGIGALYLSLSSRSRWLRFFHTLSDAEVLERARLAGKPDEISLVAVDEDRIIGEARCRVVPGEVPEFATVVADDHQRRGVGRGLVLDLCRRAAERGVQVLAGVARTENTDMLRMLRRIGGMISAPVEDGDIQFQIATVPGTPPWPPKPSRGRILVESPSMFDSPEELALWDAGYELRRCLGTATRGQTLCPLLSGRRCRTAEGADVVAILTGTEGAAAPGRIERHVAGPLILSSRDGWREFVRQATADGFSLRLAP